MPTRDSGLLTRLHRIRYSIASTGWRRGLSDVATQVLIPVLSYDPGRDRSFDRECGTDTAGSVEPSQLGIEDSSIRANAILYLPSPPRVTRWMLNNIGINYDEFTFVDLGCGKGRVLLIASGYPFKRIVGVDISPEMSRLATENALKYRPATRKCRDIEVQTRDAATVDFPDTNILLHLYHPFEPPMTDAVLAGLERSIQASPRKVVVAYLLYTAAVPQVEEVFARFPWLRKVRYEQSVLGQYNWIFYAN